mgnify:CR=1 FL=1
MQTDNGQKPAKTTAPLSGLLIVSLEQAVAAPYCSRLLAEDGARVIKLERLEGDFARAYDNAVHGESTYFAWLNGGKESVAVDLRGDTDRALLTELLSRADVFIQNLRVGAVDRLGYGWDAVHALNPRLIMCNISGFGSTGAYATKKAYDALVQAEAGLCSVTGPAGTPSKVGLSICDIATGLTAHGEVLKALLLRQQTGVGTCIDCSLFEVMAEWMSVPLAHYEHTGKMLQGTGMDHGQIAPYGAFQAGDGAVFLVVQNHREWLRLCESVLGKPELVDDPLFADNMSRVSNRAVLKTTIEEVFAGLSCARVFELLGDAGIAHGQINDLAGLSKHPALLRDAISVNGAIASMVRHVGRSGMETRNVPSLDQHGDNVRSEFLGTEMAGL